MYHDLIDEIEDRLAEVDRDSAKAVRMDENGWVVLDMKDGSSQQLFFSGESMLRSEFVEIASMILARMKSNSADAPLTQSN